MTFEMPPIGITCRSRFLIFGAVSYFESWFLISVRFSFRVGFFVLS